MEQFKKLLAIPRIKEAIDFAESSCGKKSDHSILNAMSKLRPDENSLIASCFYDALEKIGNAEIKQIKEKFGDDVAAILTNLKKLKGICYTVHIDDPETIRTMFMVMAHDMRVVLIWLNSIVLRAENLGELTEVERQKFVERAMEIFAPITARLGLYDMKHRLEDNAFKHLNPEEYKNIRRQLKKFGKQKIKHISAIKRVLEKFLKEFKIKAEISGRIKSIYSIYKKLKTRNKDSISDIFDIIAMRVVLPAQYDSSGRENVEHLYSLLGLIHSQWTPITNRFKDYIAIPKLNGYQSLHTTVLGIAPKFLDHPVEIQIRSERMHDEAELGVATHWVYKEHGKNLDGGPSNPAQKARTAWLDALKSFKSKKDLKSLDELDIFRDKIFALTPKGDVKDLPAGSTVIDFAYSVHTDIGNRAYAAKANGIAVSLDYEIENGDVIEVVLKPKPGPKVEWLSFVKTDTARSRIKEWERSQHRKEDFKVEGKNIAKKPEYSIQQPRIAVKQSKPSKKQKIGTGEIFVGGERGLPVHIAKCCNPQYPAPITGYVTKNGYIAIHSSDCKALKKNMPKKMIEASWGNGKPKSNKKYNVKIIVEAGDRIGLLRDIASILADMEANIVDMILIEKKDNFLKRAFILEINDFEVVDGLIGKLGKAHGVSRAYIK